MTLRLPAGALLLALLAAGCQSDAGSSAATTPASSARPAAETAATKAQAQNAILFFGDSITAGLGVEPDEAYPALIGQRLDSLHLPYQAINAGLSGETSAGGRSRLKWVLSRQPVGVFVLELGGNDGLRGIPLSSTRQNLQAIIDSVRQLSPQSKIVLAGMQIPPNMGSDYTAEFRKIYPDLAAKNHLTLIPFLLQGVGGDKKLNQRDGIHPTPAGHKIVAATVWQTLQPVLEKGETGAAGGSR